MKPGYAQTLRDLQIELVKLQRHFIGHDQRILVIVEGRDTAGKDGCIKRLVEHLSPRETRVVALGKPSDRERTGWYFQRWVRYLPVAQEFVIFNRSWYNRAGVERVMGFCSDAEYAEFMQSIPAFEAMLVQSGIRLRKYWLDIDKSVQRQRLAERRSDPLTQWKSSPIDATALAHWAAYSGARDAMLLHTHTETAPWVIVHANDKRQARLNLLRSVLASLEYEGKKPKLVQPDPAVAFAFTPECVARGLLAR